MKVKKLNRVLQCYVCKLKMKFDKVSNLRRHMKLHGPFVESYTCAECGLQFQNKQNLKHHWSNKHGQAEPKFTKSTRISKGILKIDSNDE